MPMLLSLRRRSSMCPAIPTGSRSYGKASCSAPCLWRHLRLPGHWRAGRIRIVCQSADGTKFQPGHRLLIHTDHRLAQGVRTEAPSGVRLVAPVRQRPAITRAGRGVLINGVRGSGTATEIHGAVEPYARPEQLAVGQKNAGKLLQVPPEAASHRVGGPFHLNPYRQPTPERTSGTPPKPHRPIEKPLSA